jgi:predicted aspartyl protease
LAAVIQKEYVSNTAWMQVKGVIPNPVNGRQTPFNVKCLIDTGFYGGVFLPNSYLLDIKSIGIEPTATTITLADGSEIVANVCAAYLQEIENYTFALPGKPIFVVIFGNEPGEVLGMNTLQHFSILFDGPNQRYIVKI